MTARLAVLIALSALLGVNAWAAPITLIHTGRARGLIGFTQFDERDFRITSFGDTDNVQEDPLNGFTKFIDHTSASINISGVGEFRIFTPTRTIVSNSVVEVLFARAVQIVNSEFILIGPSDNIISSWFMLDSVGPVEGAVDVTGLSMFTSGGNLDFAPVARNGTFQAVVVPEPTSVILMSMGLLAVGVYACRRRRWRV